VLKWHGNEMSWNSIFMDGVWWIGMGWSGTWKGLVI